METESTVAETAVAASDQLVNALEDDLCMMVSRRAAWSSIGVAKTVVTVAHQRLAKRISTSMRRLGIAVKTKAKHLGIHFAPGGRTRELHGRESRWAALDFKEKASCAAW